MLTHHFTHCLASLVAVKAEQERQQIFYKINKHMNYNKSDGSVHPHLSHKMFLKSKKPITEYKMRAVLDAADSLAIVVLVGMLHPLGDGGFFIVDAFKGGEKVERARPLSHQFLTSIIFHILAGAEEINRRLQSKPNEIQKIEAIKSEIKSESEPHIDIALKALIPCCDDGTRNVVLFEKMGTPSPEKMICGECRDNERSENVRSNSVACLILKFHPPLGVSNVAVNSPES